MKNLKNIMLAFTLITSLLVSPTKAIAEPTEIVNPVNLTVEQQVEYFSELYQADVILVKKVIGCESSWNNSASGDNSLSNGIFQFQKSTFYRMAKILGEELDYTSQYDQVKLGTYAMSKPELAREWTAYVAIQNGGTYSFYSKQLQKHFTVVCK